MSALATAPTGVEKLVLSINSEIRVKASLENTFAAIVDQMGSEMHGPSGETMNMKLEAFPGGRWYRDLGNGNGHFWGHVQSIKRPTLLEFTGPLFMSYAVISNVQYRLSEVEGGTLITFHHFAVGAIPDDVRQNIGTGWTMINEGIRTRAESKR